MNSLTKNYKCWTKKPILLVILFLGIAIRLAYVLWLPVSKYAGDEKDYFYSAIDIMQNGSFDKTVYYHVPPVTPLLYAGTFAVFGAGLIQIRIMQSFLFVLLGITLYLIGKEISGKVAGLLTVLFAAFYPYFIYFTGLALSETEGALAISAMLLFGIRATRKQHWIDCLCFGGLLAIAALTRAATFLFVVVVPFVFITAWGVSSLRWIRGTVLFLAGFLTLYLPWMVVNYKAFGEIVLTPTTGSGVMLYQTALKLTMPDKDARDRFFQQEIRYKYYIPPEGTHHDRLAGDKYLAQEGMKIIMDNLGRLPEVIWSNFHRFWQFYPNAPEGKTKTRIIYRILGLASYGVLFPFFLYGMWKSRLKFNFLAILYTFIVYFTLIHCLIYGALRYRIPMDGVILAFSACGAIWLLERAGFYSVQKMETWLT